jgi:hypothetical protein
VFMLYILYIAVHLTNTNNVSDFRLVTTFSWPIPVTECLLGLRFQIPLGARMADSCKYSFFSATGRSLVQMSLTNRGVSLCLI